MELSGAGIDSSVDLSCYKTPLLKLARRWKSSVELWKSKYFSVQATIKRYQNSAADARRSRDRWKAKAGEWQATAERLQAELDRREAAVGSDDARPKKKRLTAATV